MQMPASRPTTAPQKLNMKHTKRQLLDGYQRLVEQLQALGGVPEQRERTQRDEQALRQAMGLSVEEILQDATDFRLELQTLFTKLANRTTGELSKFEQIQLAVEVRDREHRERHGIENCAGILANLEETQRRQQEQFAEEMKRTRLEWEHEQSRHAAEVKERQAREERERAREEETFQYSFKREQQLARDAFKDKMARLLAEKEAIEEGLRQREAAIAAREEETRALEKQVEGIPQAIEKAVNEQIKATQRTADQEKGLIQKQHRGEKGTLNAKVKTLETTVKELNTRLKRVSAQRDQAQEHLQTIALRGIDESPDAIQKSSSPKEKSSKDDSVIPPLSYQGQREYDA